MNTPHKSSTQMLHAVTQPQGGDCSFNFIVFPLGGKAPRRPLRWLFGINRIPWKSIYPIHSTRPGLLAPPLPTNQSRAPHAPAAARWPSPEDGERAPTI